MIHVKRDKNVSSTQTTAPRRLLILRSLKHIWPSLHMSQMSENASANILRGFLKIPESIRQLIKQFSDILVDQQSNKSAGPTLINVQ